MCLKKRFLHERPMSTAFPDQYDPVTDPRMRTVNLMESRTTRHSEVELNSDVRGKTPV